MMISKDAAILLAVIGAGLVVVALGMLVWSGAVVEATAALGYAAAMVTGTAGASCLVIAVWWWWREHVGPPKGGEGG